MNRYEEAPMQVYDIMHSLIEKHFQELEHANILIMFDTKKKMSDGKFVLARIKKTNDEIRALTESEVYPLGYDYIIFIDKLIWENIEEEDKIRIMRHELRHANVNNEKDQPYLIRDHEITDFYDEVILNQDAPRWTERVTVIAESLYDPENKQVIEEEENFEAGV